MLENKRKLKPEDQIKSFWDWFNTHYRDKTEKLIEEFNKFVQSCVIRGGYNPADAIASQLHKKGLDWNNVTVDEKLRNIIGNAMLQNAKYLDPVELFELPTWQWEAYVTSKWELHY